MAGPWEKYQKPAAGPWEKYSKPQADISAAAEGTIDQPKEAETAGPVTAAADIGRMVAKGAFMGKEASPEDAIARDAAMRAVGKKFARGRVNPANRVQGMTPDEYRAFYDAESRAAKEAEARSGVAGKVAEIGGMMLPGSAISKGVTAGLGVASKIPGIGGVLGAPVVSSAAQGAAIGAIDNDKNRLQGALIGAGAGVLGHGAGKALTAGANKVLGMLPKNKAPMSRAALPSIDEMRTAKNAAYKSIDDAGVEYTPKAIKGLFDDIRAKLTAERTSPEIHKQAWSKLNQVEKEISALGKNGVFPAGSLNDVIKSIRRDLPKGETRDAEKYAADIVIKRINDFMANAKSGDVVRGNASAVKPLLDEANRLNSQYKKASNLQASLDDAALRAGVTYTGGNIDNATKQRVLKEFKAQSKFGMTPDETEAFMRAMQTTRGQKALRSLSGLSPSDNKLIASMLAMGGIGGAASGAALPAVAGVGALALTGMGAKAISNKIVSNSAKNLMDVIRAGGSKANITPKQVITDKQRQALIRALIAGGVVGGRGLVPGGQ